MAKHSHKNEFSHTSIVPFDPLKYVKQLEKVGFTREQAEVQAETFFSIVQEQLITKYDLKELENKLTLAQEAIRRDIKELENKLTHDMKELEVKMINQSELVRRDLKIWFGGMLVTLVLAFSALITLIPHLTGHV